MKYELEIISDIVHNLNGKPVVVTKQDRIKKLFNLYDIELEEYVDSKTGRHIKKYCTIVEENTYYKINKPYEELKALIQNKSIPILGLAAKSKRFKAQDDEEPLPEYLEDKTEESEITHYIEGKSKKKTTKKKNGKIQRAKKTRA
jgi:hypothetical protein